MDDRQALPYTPTDAGRTPKIKDFGIEGGWAVAFPVIIVGAASLFGTIMWFLTAGVSYWGLKLIVGLSPLWGIFVWIRMFVTGKPPAYRPDSWKTLRRLAFDWNEPVWPRFPIIPRVTFRASTWTDLSVAPQHPLAAARAIFGEERRSGPEPDVEF